MKIIRGLRLWGNPLLHVAEPRRSCANMRVDFLRMGEENGRTRATETIQPPTCAVSSRLDRIEMKFVVTAAQRAALMARLEAELRPDENGGGSAAYPVVSLYYDNAERDCYWERARGLGNRRKMRVRVYGSADGRVAPSAFIEVKHKCDGRGVKRRVRLSPEDALRVGSGLSPENADLREMDRRLIAEVHDLVERRGFRPVMVMRYDRCAYAATDPASDLRVTYDMGIFCRMEDLTPVPDDRRFGPRHEMHRDEMAVMEVKITGCIPYWLGRVIAGEGCKLQSHSKYSNALEQIDPVLRGMLAPGWRKPMPGPDAAGDMEMDMVPPEPGSALETVGQPVAG